jgi:hypothetical protein
MFSLRKFISICYSDYIKEKELKMQKDKSYTFTKRQISRVKGWEVSYWRTGHWPVTLGFFKTIKEARAFIANHKIVEENN